MPELVGRRAPTFGNTLSPLSFIESLEIDPMHEETGFSHT
jgi:hypothetical protein